jgi:hypothetical protein
MLFALNDRFLEKGRNLKLLTVAPELGHPMIRSGSHQRFELGAQFKLTDSTGRSISQPPSQKHDDEALGKWFSSIPISYSDLNTSEFNEGTYLVECSVARLPVGRATFMVLGAEKQEGFIREICDERLLDATPFRNPGEIAQAFGEAWRDLFSYLEISVVRHIFFDIQPAGFESLELAALRIEPFNWALFHVYRFIFDQLFYGGRVTIERNEAAERLGTRRANVFKFHLSSSLPTISHELPRDLQQLMESLSQDECRVDLEWTQTAANAADLNMAWRVG